MGELKPCPFCGNAAYPGSVRYSHPLTDATWADGSEILEAYFVNCGTCGASNRTSIADGHRTVAEAESSWNRRVGLESVNADLLEALKPFAQLAERLRADDTDSSRPAYATARNYRAAKAAYDRANQENSK